MPTYEYKCENGHVFDLIQSFSEDPLESCEVCDAPARRVLYAPAVHFKGSGFYSTDYGKKGSKGGSSDGGESSSDSSSGDSGGGDSGGDSSKGDSSKGDSSSSSSDSASKSDSGSKAAAGKD